MSTQSKPFSFKGQKIFVGLDVHLKSWSVTVLSEQAVLKLVGNCSVRTGRSKEVHAGSEPCCFEQVSDQHVSGCGVLFGLRGRFLRVLDTLGVA